MDPLVSLGEIGHAILVPLYYAISAIMLGWHWLFSLVLDDDGGAAWALSIVGLTLVIRALLIPLFVKQIKSSRNMQLLQPKVKELQKKYGHDRERLAQETMKLYKDAGTNPFASCMPLILQMPIFFALFRLLDQAARHDQPNGFLSESLANSFGDSRIFGTIPLAGSFTSPQGQNMVQVVAAILVLAMTATTFITQRQLMSKNMPPDALTGPYAQQQKILLYVLPVVFAVGGIAFPIGVIMYWTTSNLWTMGQQFYVIRNNPAPGTEAFRAKEERDRRKKAGHGEDGGDGGGVATLTAETTATGQPESASSAGTDGDRRRRQQPKKQSRSQRRSTRPSQAQRSGKKK